MLLSYSSSFNRQHSCHGFKVLVFSHNPKSEVCFTPVFELISVLSSEGDVPLLCVQGMPSSAWASPSWSSRKLTGRQWLSKRSPRQWPVTSATGHRTFRRLTLLHTTLQWPLLGMQVPLHKLPKLAHLQNWPLNSTELFITNSVLHLHFRLECCRN